MRWLAGEPESDDGSRNARATEAIASPRRITMAKTLVFDVKGMTCDNCVAHVTQAVKGVVGVTGADVSLARNTATVEGDFDEQSVVAAIEEEGYETARKP
jgi:copper chaperone